MDSKIYFMISFFVSAFPTLKKLSYKNVRLDLISLIILLGEIVLFEMFENKSFNTIKSLFPSVICRFVTADLKIKHFFILSSIYVSFFTKFTIEVTFLHSKLWNVFHYNKQRP